MCVPGRDLKHEQEAPILNLNAKLALSMGSPCPRGAELGGWETFCSYSEHQAGLASASATVTVTVGSTEMLSFDSIET